MRPYRDVATVVGARAFCGRHWMKEYSGLGKARSMFFVSRGTVAVYYITLLGFFWEMIPNA